MDSQDVDVDRRGLVLVSDPELLDGLLRLAAAAGCELVRVVDAAQARRYWSRAPLVLLDPRTAQDCVRDRLPRRGGVVVAVRGEPPPSVWQQAVAIGAEHVVSLPEAEPWLVAALAEAAEGVRQDGTVLAVVGGRGGAGASVFATALAVSAARSGEQVLLVDCDILGGGLDLVLGAEDLDGLRWPDLGISAGRVAAAALRAALPAPTVGAGPGKLSLLACGRSDIAPTAEAVSSVVTAGRSGAGLVVCDVPRHPVAAAVAALRQADLTVLVVPADVRSCAAAGRVAPRLVEHGAPVGLIVRGPAPGGIDAAEVSRALGLPVLATMRPEPGLARSLERGSAPGRSSGPLAGAARTVLENVRGLRGDVA